MRILVTGSAGFIGSHVCEKLLQNPEILVLGIDNMDNYYDTSLKIINTKILEKYSNFTFNKDDICTTDAIRQFKPDKICHMASLTGVRNSLINPKKYIKVNIEGFIHILEEAVKNEVKHIVYASSSSVYGLNEKIPFSEDDVINKCNSPYAVSKMSMELLANTYGQLYDISTTGLRFFTVYGPRGRPDMAPYKFLKAIWKGDSFEKYGDGSSLRDYTYIDDIVDGILASLNNNRTNIYNLGNSNPVTLNEFISTCEDVVNKKAIFTQISVQLGDVPVTYANINKAKSDLNYIPKISLKEGLCRTFQYMKDNEIPT